MIQNKMASIASFSLIKGRAWDRVITKKKMIKEEQIITTIPLRIFPNEFNDIYGSSTTSNSYI